MTSPIPHSKQGRSTASEKRAVADRHKVATSPRVSRGRARQGGRHFLFAASHIEALAAAAPSLLVGVREGEPLRERGHLVVHDRPYDVEESRRVDVHLRGALGFSPSRRRRRRRKIRRLPAGATDLELLRLSRVLVGCLDFHELAAVLGRGLCVVERVRQPVTPAPPHAEQYAVDLRPSARACFSGRKNIIARFPGGALVFVRRAGGAHRLSRSSTRFA